MNADNPGKKLMEMNLRQATPADAEGLAELHVAAWKAAYRDVVPEAFLEHLDVVRRRSQWEEFLTEHPGRTFVTERDNRIIGFATIGPCRDDDLDARTTGEIWGIYIAPPHWREGVGRFLCRSAERRLKPDGYTEVALWVFRDNAAARRFYEAMGFALDGATKELSVGATLTAVRYRKLLP